MRRRSLLAAFVLLAGTVGIAAAQAPTDPVGELVAARVALVSAGGNISEALARVDAALAALTTTPTTAPTTTAATTTTVLVTTTTVIATTTTAPPTTTTTIVTGILIRPGDNAGAIVAAAPTGSTFIFTPGVHVGASIAPKANQVFLGQPGAILRGNGKPFAFRSAADGVIIRGLLIEGYAPASRAAVVDGVDGGTGWIVEGNEVANNTEIGIRARAGWTVRNNYVHHNGRYGITGGGAGILIEGNEIAFNANILGATGDSSGTKFAHTTNLILRNNNAHDNEGNGLWVDINNINALIEGNVTNRNTRNGIFLEISCGGVIRNNHTEGNGTNDLFPNWAGSGTGIQISMTPDVEVYGNVVVGNSKGIGAIQWDHQNVGAVTACVPDLRNLRVFDNEITQDGGMAAGIDASVDASLVFGVWDNQFDNNVYTLSGDARFRYQGGWVTYAQWITAGQN